MDRWPSEMQRLINELAGSVTFWVIAGAVVFVAPLCTSES